MKKILLGGTLAAAVLLPLPLEAAPITRNRPSASRKSAVSPYAKGQPSQQRYKQPGRAEANRKSQITAVAANPVEVIYDRFADGKVRVQRHVTLDGQGNYVNHGEYREFNQRGQVIRQGQFNLGRQVGAWSWAFQPGQAPLYSGEWEDRFQGPFLSQATFHDGKLHGVWSISTAKGQKVFEWAFDAGVRQGVSSWWFPNGQLRRQVDYVDNVEQGTLAEWRPDGKMIRQEAVGGGRLKPEVHWYDQKHKLAEGYRYVQHKRFEASYDWWNGQVLLTQNGDPGPDLLHGKWTWYYPNGQVQLQGEYDRGQPDGRFVWFHDNGQPAEAGDFVDGVRQGVWKSWYATGRRSSQGKFQDDIPTGEWQVWDESGNQQSVDATDESVAQFADPPTKFDQPAAEEETSLAASADEEAPATEAAELAGPGPDLSASDESPAEDAADDPWSGEQEITAASPEGEDAELAEDATSNESLTISIEPGPSEEAESATLDVTETEESASSEDDSFIPEAMPEETEEASAAAVPEIEEATAVLLLTPATGATKETPPPAVGVESEPQPRVAQRAAPPVRKLYPALIKPPTSLKDREKAEPSTPKAP